MQNIGGGLTVCAVYIKVIFSFWKENISLFFDEKAVEIENVNPDLIPTFLKNDELGTIAKVESFCKGEYLF